MGDMADLYDELVDRAFHGDEDDGEICNRCGQTDLEWVKTGVRWRLFEDGKPHICRQIDVSDDFEDLG